MFEYDIKRFNRRCSKTGHEFKAGDVYYSAVVEDGDAFSRFDYSVDAWDGPPEGALGWWRSQVATADPNRVYWAPAPLLLEYFVKISQSPEKSDVYYLMALVLLRKKLLQLVESSDETSGVRDMLVHAPRLKQDFRVPVCQIDVERARQLQLELCEHLFSDRPLDVDEVESMDAADAG
jgi:hypothetical protein